ncbi:lytic transglycosylase domain-containing protein [Marivita sp.]|uniref:lytic transglycosylase domain-containing protein n=1 Tax=Marivita sp. TaxID=2003365 RepID=UPI00262FB16E|nr:lytic transglycosylase domain-containing protein [Marivita sp.]
MFGIWSKSTVLAVALALLLGTISNASICDIAAQRAASETGVPLDVMQTITRLETGRGKTGDPWPWTVNHAGDGSWFQTEDDARSYVFSQVKRGESNLDIGCFQINYRWHASGFQSLDDMFDPDLNALYAARFLADLYREFGNWTEAAGAYHSRTPVYADRYKAKFQNIRGRVTDLVSVDPGTSNGRSDVRWGQSGTSRPGSLFLSGAADRRPFIGLQRTN